MNSLILSERARLSACVIICPGTHVLNLEDFEEVPGAQVPNVYDHCAKEIALQRVASRRKISEESAARWFQIWIVQTEGSHGKILFRGKKRNEIAA